MRQTDSREEFERLCQKIFTAADTDNSGDIDKYEMLAMFTKLVPEEERESFKEDT